MLVDSALEEYFFLEGKKCRVVNSASANLHHDGKVHLLGCCTMLQLLVKEGVHMSEAHLLLLHSGTHSQFWERMLQFFVLLGLCELLPL